jgi:hypothetical protein
LSIFGLKSALQEISEATNAMTITLSYYSHHLPWPAKFSIKSALQEMTEEINAITITLSY